MKKHLLIVCALAAALCLGLLASCSAPSAGSVNVGKDGRATSNGSELVVTLKGNPTTGYEWKYEIQGKNLQFVDSNYVADSNATGSGGTYTFRFKATGSSEATIVFTYARGWEKTDQDATCKVKIDAGIGGNIKTVVGIG